MCSAATARRGYDFASGLRAGRVCFNGANTNSLTPMGGYKQSGIGRSMGVFGLEEYLEDQVGLRLRGGGQPAPGTHPLKLSALAACSYR